VRAVIQRAENIAVAIAKDLAEKEMCLPYLIEELKNAYDNLSDTQEQLRVAEKLASSVSLQPELRTK